MTHAQQRSATRSPEERPAPRRRGRPAADSLHAIAEEDVLALAFRSFAERGYEGTTMRALAKALGGSHNFLNVRFGTKAELWRKAVDAQVARSGPEVFGTFDAAGLDDETRLRTFISRLCRWAAGNSHFVALANMESRRATWRNEHLVDRYLKPLNDQLEALLARVTGGHAGARVSAAAFMSMIVNGVGAYVASGPMLARLGLEDEIAGANRDRQVEVLTDLFIHSLLGDARQDAAQAMLPTAGQEVDATRERRQAS